MSKTESFIENAKQHLEQLGAELTEMENKVAAAGDEADEWAKSQATRLKQDWKNAHQEMTHLAERAQNESEEAIGDAKEKAQRHWEALNAAVTAYRGHLDNTVDV